MSFIPKFAVFILTAFIVFTLAPKAAADEVVPRTIIALYEGGDIADSYIHSVVEMPLNQLGLTIEYHDIHDPLPEITNRPDVRGIITWFYGDIGIDPDQYLKWALSAVEAGKKYVIVGSLGISEDKQFYSESPLVDHLMDRLGFKMMDTWVTQPLKVTYTYNTKSLFLNSSSYQWANLPYQVIHIENDKAQAHLTAHRDSLPSDESAIIITSPTGGFLDPDYAIRMNEVEGIDITQWIIDPFAYFRLAFGTDDLPKPDASTVAGRRLFYSNIDGDGWNNVTQLQEYQGKKILSSQIVLDKAVRPYPDLPVMVAPIAADIDPNWSGTEASRVVARDFWSLPWVEAGTHTYSHPFEWQFFKDGDPNMEIPYLPLYKSKTWTPSPEAIALSKKNTKAAAAFAKENSVPRAFAREPFEIHKEIGGSLEELAPLLPPGKKIEILAWPGNCAPWEDVVRMTREAGVQNINGGDTRFDPEYPAYASVAPIGKQVGNQRQIYASTSNENTYTDLWTANFHAFGYLRKTIDNTETPMRLKPFSIYYHMYSGEKEASLSALLANLNYARNQDLAPVTAGAYTHIAEGFYQTKIVALGNDRWRVENRGALSTIRFDQASLKAVNFDSSSGVIGQRHFQGSLYVYLDANIKDPVIALKADDHYFEPLHDNTTYLIESRWLISNLQRTARSLEFESQGYGNGDMSWQMATPGTYKITANGKSFTQATATDGLLTFSLSENAVTSIHITITEM